MTASVFEILEKEVPACLIAGIRMKGKYSDCGPAFARIGQRFGRHLCGKAMMLHYDREYHESHADFEACMPIEQGDSVENITVRELPGGHCIALRHQGPYDTLCRSYTRLLRYAQERGLEIVLPTREVYIKGPGMIFRGNPNRYITEIQFFTSG